MNNIKQKNVMYGNEFVNRIPYQNYTCFKFNQNQNINHIRLDNIEKQLVNNDVFLENSIKQQSQYQYGPKTTDNLYGEKNGFKYYDDYLKTDLSIMHKVDAPIGDTVHQVQDFCSTNTFKDRKIVFVARSGDCILVGAENGIFYKRDDQSCYSQCNSKDGSEIGSPTCVYSDGSLVFIGTTNGLYQFIMTEDRHDTRIVYVVRLDNLTLDEIQSIGYRQEDGMILLSNKGQIMCGHYLKSEEKIEFKLMGELNATQYQLDDTQFNVSDVSLISTIKTIGYSGTIDENNSILIGTDKGLYRNKKCLTLNNKQKTYNSQILSYDFETRYSFSDGTYLFLASADRIDILKFDLSLNQTINLSDIKGSSQSNGMIAVWSDNTITVLSKNASNENYETHAIKSGLSHINGCSFGSAQGYEIIFAAINKQIVAYRVNSDWTVDQFESVVESTSNITDVCFDSSSQRLYYSTKSKLYDVEVKGIEEGKLITVDSIQRISDVNPSRIIKIQNNQNQNDNTIFLSQGNKIYIYENGQIQDEPVYTADATIVDFDAYNYNGMYELTIGTNDSFVVFKMEDETELAKRTIIGDKVLSIVNSGSYVVVLTQQNIYTIDLDKDHAITMQSNEFSVKELHNDSTDNSLTYGITQTNELRTVKLQSQIKIQNTDKKTDGHWITKMNPYSQEYKEIVYVQSENCLCVYHPSSTEYECTKIDEGKKSNRLLEIEQTYANCTNNGMYTHNIEDDTLVSSMFTGSNVLGGYVTENTRLYGIYVINGGLSSFGDKMIQTYDGYCKTITENNVMYEHINSDGTTKKVYTTNENTVSVEGVGSKSFSDERIVNIQMNEISSCLVVTNKGLYKNILNSTFTKEDVGSIDGDIVCSLPTNISSDSSTKVYQLTIFAAGKTIYCTKKLNGTVKNTYKLVEADDNVKCVTLYNNYTGGIYVTFNTKNKITTKKLIIDSSDDISFTDNDLTWCNDYTRTDGEIQSSVLDTIEQVVVYSITKSGTTDVYKNDSIYKYGIMMLYVRNQYGFQNYYIVNTDNSIDFTLGTYGEQHITIDESTQGRICGGSCNQDRFSIITTKGCVYVHFEQNQLTEIKKLTLKDNTKIDVKNVTNIVKLSKNDSEKNNDIIVVHIDGRFYFATFDNTITDSRFETCFTDVNNAINLMFKDDYVYVISQGTDHQLMSIYHYKDSGDGFDLIKRIELSDNSQFLSISDLTNFVNPSGSLYSKQQDGTISLIYEEQAFACGDRIVTDTIRKAVWSDEETDTVKKQCFFLTTEGEIFSIIDNNKVDYHKDSEIQDFNVANGVFFLKKSGKWEYQQNMEYKEFHSYDGTECDISNVRYGGKLNGYDRYIYSFSNINGVFRNEQYDFRGLIVTDSEVYEGDYSLGTVKMKVIGQGQLGIMSKNKLQMEYFNTSVGDHSIKEMLQDYYMWNMWFVDNRSDNSDVFVSIITRSGLFRYSNSNLNQLPRFSEDGETDDLVFVCQNSDRTMLVFGDYIITYDGIQYSGQYRLIGSDDLCINHLEDIGNGKYLISTNRGEYYTSEKNGVVSVPSRVSTNEFPICKIQKVIDSDSTYYVMASENTMLNSDNFLKWNQIFETPSDCTINDFIVEPNNIFYMATERGLYKTEYIYTVKNDFYKYKESDLFRLYNDKKDDFHEIYEEKEDKHIDQSEYGHQEGGLMQTINDSVMDVGFSRFNETDRKDWQVKTTHSESGITTTCISNDIVDNILFGDQNTGDIEIDVSNFLVSSDNTTMNYIVKRWMSGLTEVYIYIPTTDTYYINHIEGVPNCKMYSDTMQRKNLRRFGNVKSNVNGDMNKTKTNIEVSLNSVVYSIDVLLDVDINGNSLPLKIYKDSDSYEYEGVASQLFHSFVQPSVLENSHLDVTYDYGVNYGFSFSCFGSDAQAIKISFMDYKYTSDLKTFNLVFNPNGGSGNMGKQIVSMDETRLTKLKENKFVCSGKTFIGWSFSKNPKDFSSPDLWNKNLFCYSDQYIPQKIYDAIKNGTNVNLYAIWGGNDKVNKNGTSFTVKSTGEDFYFNSVYIDENTEYGDTVVVNYKG